MFFHSNGSLDFDHWAGLAKRDPASFEQARLDAIEQFIGQAPAAHQARLRRLQWRIDQERRRSRNPMGACVRISQMMWDSLLGEQGLRERLLELGALFSDDGRPLPQAVTPVDSTAEVVSMADYRRRACGRAASPL